jgi:hypothetical protein
MKFEYYVAPRALNIIAIVSNNFSGFHFL